MFNIVLYQPEIPPNTGNIMRLCANTGCRLHLIQPLGFSLEDKHLKRAGLDYTLPHPVKLYSSFEEYTLKNGFQSDASQHSRSKENNSILYLCSTKANQYYTDVFFKPGDSLVFGPETRGLPQDMLQSYPEHQKIKIPMQASSRSLNLSNAVAIIIYEAWRQQGFKNINE